MGSVCSLGKRYRTGLSCTIHPFSAGFCLIAWLVWLLWATRWISWITCICQSHFMAVAKVYSGGQGSICFYVLRTEKVKKFPFVLPCFEEGRVIHPSTHTCMHTQRRCILCVYFDVLWHLLMPLVCVGMAEGTSQWVSSDHWTVKSLGTPVGGLCWRSIRAQGWTISQMSWLDMIFRQLKVISITKIKNLNDLRMSLASSSITVCCSGW